MDETQSGRSNVDLPNPPYITDNSGPLVIQLIELFSRKEKKVVPIPKETASNIVLTDWLKVAEWIAGNNHYDDEQRLCFLTDTLKDEAADWIIEMLNQKTAIPNSKNGSKTS